MTLKARLDTTRKHVKRQQGPQRGTLLAGFTETFHVEHTVQMLTGTWLQMLFV